MIKNREQEKKEVLKMRKQALKLKAKNDKYEKGKTWSRVDEKTIKLNK